MFSKVFNWTTGFEKFKKIYIKFIEEELQNLQYPSISGYDPPRCYDPVFGQVNNFFRKKDITSAFQPVSREVIYADLIKQKEEETVSDYKKSVWDHYREMFNESYREIELRKEKRLKTLNEKKYPEYFATARISIDTIFESKSAEETYRNNPLEFEKLILIILCGKYSEMGTIQQNPNYFPPITNSECKERLEKLIPRYKNGIIPKSVLGNVFVRELTRLRDILLNIAEHELIINTINKFEIITFDDNGTGVPEIEIPCYKEFMDSNNDGKIKQEITDKNIKPESENSQDESSAKKKDYSDGGNNQLNNKEKKIEKIVEDIAHKTSNKDSGKYEPNTRKIYFMSFIESPTLIRKKLIKKIIRENEIIEKDEKKLRGEPPSILSTWEKNLRKELMAAGFENLAQRLKRQN